MVRNMVILSAIKMMNREDWSQEGWKGLVRGGETEVILRKPKDGAFKKE